MEEQNEYPLEQDTQLLIHIEQSKPIEVEDFSKAMSAFGSLYSDFVKKNGGSEEMAKSKLYVEKIEKGSIDIYFCEMASMGLIAFENMNTIIEFAKNLKSIFDYFCCGKGDEPECLSAQTCDDVYDLLGITANDPQGKMDIGTVIRGDNYGTINYNYILDYPKSGSGQNNAKKAKDRIKEIQPQEVEHNQVLMTIVQCQKKEGTKGNKGIIQDIDKSQKSIIFATPELENAIIHGEDNPTKKGFLVDVIEMHANNKLQAYKVTKLYETIDID